MQVTNKTIDYVDTLQRYKEILAAGDEGGAGLYTINLNRFSKQTFMIVVTTSRSILSDLYYITQMGLSPQNSPSKPSQEFLYSDQTLLSRFCSQPLYFVIYIEFLSGKSRQEGQPYPKTVAYTFKSGTLSADDSSSEKRLRATWEKIAALRLTSQNLLLLTRAYNSINSYLHPHSHKDSLIRSFRLVR